MKIDNCIGSLIEVEIRRLGDARLDKIPEEGIEIIECNNKVQKGKEKIKT